MCVCTHALTEAERTLSEVQSCTSASPPVISVGHMQKDPPCAARAAHRARMTLCWSPGFIVPDDGEKKWNIYKMSPGWKHQKTSDSSVPLLFLSV